MESRKKFPDIKWLKLNKIRLMVYIATTVLVPAALLGQITEKVDAPDFVLLDMEGENYQLLKNLGDGPIVINFWATWCVPCREEMKKLNKLYTKLRLQGLEILAISIDDPKTVGRVKNFIKSRKYSFKVLLDTNGEILRLYQGITPPYTVLLDATGKIEYTKTGYRKGDIKKLKKRIESLLRVKE